METFAPTDVGTAFAMIVREMLASEAPKRREVNADHHRLTAVETLARVNFASGQLRLDQGRAPYALWAVTSATCAD